MPTPKSPNKNAPRAPEGRSRAIIAGGIILFGVIGLFGLREDWLSQPPATPAETIPIPVPLEMTPWITPGNRLPPVKKADVANLPDDTPVIGIETDEKFRAYRVEAFHPVNAHVVIDSIGETAITVTYCHRTDCTHVFTDNNRVAPLKIDLGGYTRKMCLNVDGGFFYQDDGKTTTNGQDTMISHASHPFERTTWKQWQEARPAMEIYVGPPVKKANS